MHGVVHEAKGAVLAVEGTCDDRFVPVREQLEQSIRSGDDVGASVAIVHDGRLVVDLWGGTATFDDGVVASWGGDTLINVWSTSKVMVALCALVLVDRGWLDLDEPVAAYWPEFGANGKGDVRVRHLLSHSSGLSGWEEPMALSDLYDWEKATSSLAAQAPWWEPGTQSGYHGITYGYLIGEVVRRVTGLSIGRFLAEEVATVGGGDFFIGTPSSVDRRVAAVIPPPASFDLSRIDPTSVLARSVLNPPLDAATSATVAWRRAEIPAAGGHGTARALATAQAFVSHGGEVGGVRLLSEATVDEVFATQTHGPDLVLSQVIRFGVGYALNAPELALGPNPRTCFWGGWGGSLCVNDLDSRTTFAFVMNRMGEGTVGDHRAHGLLDAFYGALERAR